MEINAGYPWAIGEAPQAPEEIRGKVFWVELAALQTGQWHIKARSLLSWLAFTGPFPPIDVAFAKGAPWIVDGNHRAWIEKIRGRKWILARHW